MAEPGSIDRSALGRAAAARFARPGLRARRAPGGARIGTLARRSARFSSSAGRSIVARRSLGQAVPGVDTGGLPVGLDQRLWGAVELPDNRRSRDLSGDPGLDRLRRLTGARRRPAASTLPPRGLPRASARGHDSRAGRATGPAGAARRLRPSVAGITADPAVRSAGSGGSSRGSLPPGAGSPASVPALPPAGPIRRLPADRPGPAVPPAGTIRRTSSDRPDPSPPSAPTSPIASVLRSTPRGAGPAHRPARRAPTTAGAGPSPRALGPAPFRAATGDRPAGGRPSSQRPPRGPAPSNPAPVTAQAPDGAARVHPAVRLHRALGPGGAGALARASSTGVSAPASRSPLAASRAPATVAGTVGGTLVPSRPSQPPVAPPAVRPVASTSASRTAGPGPASVIRRSPARRTATTPRLASHPGAPIGALPVAAHARPAAPASASLPVVGRSAPAARAIPALSAPRDDGPAGSSFASGARRPPAATSGLPQVTAGSPAVGPAGRPQVTRGAPPLSSTGRPSVTPGSPALRPAGRPVATAGPSAAAVLRRSPEPPTVRPALAVRTAASAPSLDDPSGPTGRGKAHRFQAATTGRSADPVRPLPPAYAPLVQAITGGRPVGVASGPTSRAGLAASASRAATVGSVIHLPRPPAAQPAPRDLATVAHELVHAARPSSTPRMLDDDRPSPEEREARRLERAIAASARRAAQATPVAPSPGRPVGTGGLPVGGLTGLGSALSGGTPLLAPPSTPGSAGTTADTTGPASVPAPGSPVTAPASSTGPAPGAPTTGGPAAPTGGTPIPGWPLAASDEGGTAGAGPATAAPRRSQSPVLSELEERIVEAVRRRVVADLERRGLADPGVLW